MIVESKARLTNETTKMTQQVYMMVAYQCDILVLSGEWVS